MTTEYTPTTEEVREAAGPYGSVAIERDAFDRWLAERDRQVAEKAWDEGYDAALPHIRAQISKELRQLSHGADTPAEQLGYLLAAVHVNEGTLQ